MQITVLMPVYNNEKHLKPAIFSILNQSYKNFEFLIIDDGSSDESPNIIKSIQDTRIKFISKEHTGLWDTLNYGLKIAQNNIIARMDADDISLPSRIEKQITHLKLNPQTDIISSWYAMFDKKIQYIIKTSEKSDDIKKRMLLHSEIVHSGLIYKRDKILSLGGYNNYMIEDHEFWIRNLNKLIFRNIQEVLTLVRDRSDSTSRINIFKKNKEIYFFLSQYQDLHHKNFELNINHLKFWKEYFYGSKTLSRLYFKKIGLKMIFNPRIILAYIFSFASDELHLKMKELRIKFRIQYCISYFSKSNENLRRFFTATQKDH